MLYFDYAASTPLHPKALEAMTPYFSEIYGNPSGAHAQGGAAKNAVEAARQGIADILNAGRSEVFFTAGGTDAANWAVFGAARAGRGRHVITSAVEHHAVLAPCEELARQGFEVTVLRPDGLGLVGLSRLEEALRPDTCLVSIMTANNEVGTIQPVKELAAAARERGAVFHTDAVQAVGHIPVDVEELGVDLLSFSGHKFYGPKGCGGLYVRKGTKLAKHLFGGGQEMGRRAGTENVAGIVGMHEALKIAAAGMEAERERLERLRDMLASAIVEKVPHSRINGAAGKGRLPGNVHATFDFIEGESLLMHLGLHGVCASTGSACSSGSLDPSHVLLAMGLSHAAANGSLRLSLGSASGEADIGRLAALLAAAVEKLRKLSPLYDDFVKTGRAPDDA